MAEKDGKRQIVFATGNRDKLREIRQIMAGLPYTICSMEEAGFTGEIVEDGATFAENAEIKARAVWAVTGGIVLADDSGFVVDCLNGEPGLYSARYMEGQPYSVKNRTLLERAAGFVGKERSARFVCNIAALLEDGSVLHTEAAMEGILADEPAGENGFGYDPILYLPDRKMTSAQLAPQEKNAISHRGKALRMMRELLEKRGQRA